MKKLIIILICFLGIQSLQTDSIGNIQENCETQIKDRDQNAFITFYGDSLGDFVDFPAYGFVGWDAYLGFWKPDIDWRVQNFAIAGWTTQSIFDGLTKCLTEQTREQRTKFVTSNHIALEVGGNDFLNMTPTLIFMPWKYWSYTDPTTGKEVKGAVDVTLHNIKVLIYYFRHPLIDKDVLVMGNFPGLTYSPTLGNIGDYFDGVKSLGDVMYQKWNEKVGPIDVVANYQKQNLETLMDIAKEVLESTFYVATALFGSQVGETLDSFLDGIFPNKEKIPGAIEPFQTNAPDWYFKWVYHTYRNPTTAISFGLYLMQPGLESLAMDLREKTRNWDRTFTYKEDNTQTYTAQNRKGGDYVHFLPLYHTLVRKYDCSAYLYCWVGQPMYYRDATPGHINHFGYYVWANALSQKIEDLGWHNDRDLRFGGAPQDPGFEMPIEPEDEKGNKLGTETLETTDIDFMLLLCFFFGSCHF